ncbi:MAG: hypothetical protein LBD88_00825 [Candidatus Peribacteria bacterium]|jgi:hypothetical protein|nr:hypothetical protein [Candidatus Peribacteria bacterium]
MRYEPIYPDFYEQLGPSLTSPYQREEQDQNPPNLLYQGEIENSPLDKGRGSKYSSTNQGGIETSPLDKGGQRGGYRKSNDLYL